MSARRRRSASRAFVLSSTDVLVFGELKFFLAESTRGWNGRGRRDGGGATSVGGRSAETRRVARRCGRRGYHDVARRARRAARRLLRRGRAHELPPSRSRVARDHLRKRWRYR